MNKRQADRLTEIFRLRTKKLMKERTKNKTRSVPNFKSAFEVVEKWVFLSISPTLCLVSLHYRCCGCGSEPAPPSWSLISAWAEGSQPRRERFASLRRPPSASCPILRSSCICTELLKITNQSSREGQDDPYKALEELYTTRSSSSLAYLHKSSFRFNFQTQLWDRPFLQTTQKTRSKNLKLSEERVWQGVTVNVYWFSVKKTREGQDSTILQPDPIIWLMATCSSHTTIQCDYHTPIRSKSAERPEKLLWLT